MCPEYQSSLRNLWVPSRLVFFLEVVEEAGRELVGDCYGQHQPLDRAWVRSDFLHPPAAKLLSMVSLSVHPALVSHCSHCSRGRVKDVVISADCQQCAKEVQGLNQIDWFGQFRACRKSQGRLCFISAAPPSRNGKNRRRREGKWGVRGEGERSGTA